MQERYKPQSRLTMERLHRIKIIKIKEIENITPGHLSLIPDGCSTLVNSGSGEFKGTHPDSLILPVHLLYIVTFIVNKIGILQDILNMKNVPHLC
jgi:hypothetical protein